MSKPFFMAGPGNRTLRASRNAYRLVSVFAIHLLGDAISPLIVGALSDAFSLQQAITILPVAVLVGGVVWIWAARAQAASKDLSLEPVS
jgi:fucose permease